MAGKKKTTEQTSINNNLPDFIIDIPNNNNVDISKWCANIRCSLGKQYNIIFNFPKNK